MTLSYSLHFITNIVIADVLKSVFDTDNVERLPQVVGVMYTRGSVFLAHGRETDAKNKLRFQQDFNFNSEISVSYFPDGVSSVNKAMHILLDGLLRWLSETEDDILLVSNNRDLVFMRQEGELTVAEKHPYWTSDRLKLIPESYIAWQNT